MNGCARVLMEEKESLENYLNANTLVIIVGVSAYVRCTTDRTQCAELRRILSSDYKYTT